jgi:hypothetical protein
MSALTLVLTFDRDRWHACGGDVDVAHRELRGLEQLIETQLAPEAPVVVHLEFDMRSVPRWLHQYHGHYCNYTLRVARPGTEVSQ